jgi:hypothetical protein
MLCRRADFKGLMDAIISTCSVDSYISSILQYNFKGFLRRVEPFLRSWQFPSCLRIYLLCMEPKGFTVFTRAAPYSYREPYKSYPYRLPSDLFLSSFPFKIMYSFITSPMLDFHTVWSSVYFLQLNYRFQNVTRCRKKLRMRLASVMLLIRDWQSQDIKL